MKGSAMDKFLEETRGTYQLPAVGAVVTNSTGAPLYLGATGKRRLDAEPSVTVNDKFHLGSCTKSMTATLAALLVEKGLLSWESTIGENFSEMPIAAEFKPVTLRQLLAHRAGVGDIGKSTVWGELWARTLLKRGSVMEQRDFVVHEIVRNPPIFKPGEQYFYANGGYIIAGAMMERATKKSWESNMIERLFEPLGMTAAGFGPPAQAGQIDQPWGHKINGSSCQPIEPGLQADNPPAVGPAGTVHCSLPDLAKYMAFHLQDDEETTALPLTRASRRKLHAPWPNGGYDNGWQFVERSWAGGTALTHSGSNTLFYAVMWLAPKKDFAVGVVTNIAGTRATKACDEIASEVIKQSLGSNWLGLIRRMMR